ncbi:MAG: T9SS type A sorting domain-containing protein, partial [Bacteroidetes bacterium]|nr:T9SS type A sorting domain-containing protein [Bacteroidota bacterium]
TVIPAGGLTPHTYLWSTLSGFETLTGLSAGNYAVTVTDARGCTLSGNTTITAPPYIATYTDTVAKILFDERNCRQYPIEKIGNQWWMTENLNVGTQINSTAGGQHQTNNSIIEKYCYDNNPANCTTYGGLYEWGEAMNYAPSDSGNPGTTQGVCPTGWRLPTDAEWCELENFIDPTTDPACNLTGYLGTDIGTKLKDNISWDGTNASGFFALPAGIRHFDGSFINPGMNEDFWSATELSGADAWLRGLFTGNPGSDRINGDKAYGFSVRCLQDFVPPLTISISSTNITCNGDSSGSATVTASGGVTPYSYLWSTLSGFQTLTGLSAGNYTVTVTDAASNTATDSVTITQPPYTATYTDTVAKILFDERNCKQYPIEKIGNQWWMKENLNVGTQINSTTGGQLQTDNGILEKYCYNNNPANCATYGGLYEWGEAMGYASSDNGNPGTTQGVCPTGWRLPTDYEWCEMENFIDPTTDPVCNLPSWRGTDIGTKLKDDVSWNGTNTSGFSALPAGYRNYSNGSFSNLNLNALLWSATVASGTYAWDRVLSTGNSQSNHDTSGKTNGFSVRCLRDIDSFDSLTVSISSTNVNCNGDSSGSATVTASGGVTPYSYLWSTLSGFQTLTGLSAGNYTVTVTDAASNTITDSVTITEPAYIATYTDTVAKILFDERNCKQYPIEKIGSQWWMTENLNVGTQINSTAGGQLQTNNSIIEKYCYDNNPANCTTYGGLYEWGEAMNYATSDNGNPGTTQGVCPTGWRLPTDAEWCEMENFIDPTTDPGCNTTGLRGTDAGTKLKDNNSWNGTNTNGFTALPAGSRDFSDGSFYNLGSSANFWSATEDAGTTAWYRILTTGFSQSIRNPLEKPSGCSVRCLQDIIPPLTISVSSTNVSCNGDSTGSVTVTASGGVTPYSYLWSTLSGFQTLTGLSAGNYTVTVTDAASATATDSVTITQSAFIATYTDTVAKILFDERNCRQYPIEKISNQWWMTENLNVGTQINSTTGGQLQTNNSILEKYCYNNNSAYCDTFGALYEWNEAMGYAASDSGNPGITQGVCPTGWRLPTDAEWCELENLIDVTTDPACNLTGNRGIDVGTKLKDNISWSGTNSSGFSALPAGNRNYSNGSLNSLGSDAQFWSATENGGTIAWVRALYTGSSQSYRDNYNKTYGFSVRCLQDVVPPLTISISSTNVACNGDSSGSATVTTSGGTPPYTYLWNTVPPSGGQGVTGLQAGTYTVTVTDAASNTATDSVTITQPPALAITTFNPTFITCNGDSDGGMNPGYFGGTPPYTYLWSNGDTTGAITNLTAGTYTFTITDANGCTFWDFMYLPDPPLISVSTVSSDVSCYGGSDGTITATVSGGTPPYTYNWSNMQTDSVATGLAINSYSVIVNDTNGCSVLAYDTIREPSFFTIQGTSVNGVSCFGGNDGAIDITVTGGVTPYSYLWSTGYTGEDISGLDTGWYDVTVTDANGCNAGAGNSINQPALLTISVSSTGASCSGVNDGSATVTASGGVQPYDYLWSNGNTNSVAAAVAGGSYSVTVSDLNGCTIVDSVTINNLASLTISFTVSNTTCGAANGSAAAFVSGGQTPYTYYWSNTQTGPLATGLASGLITCTVTDNVGCIIVDSTMINTITPPSVNIIFTSPSCSGSSDGTAVATVAGGSPPYAYQWSNLSGFQNLSGLSAGNFSVTVTDSLGCMATDNIVLTSPPLLTVSVSSTDVTTCGGNDGTAAAAAAGGSGNYTYQWSNGLTTSAVSGLSAGTYTVIVYDANGCAESDIAVVNGYSGTLSVTITKTDVSCYGGDDGTVDVAASGGSAPYTYLWSNLSGFQNLTGLSAGNYTVTVTDASGCIGTGTAVITEPAQISVSFQNITNPSCGFSDGSAMAVPSGGTPPYEFIWTNNDTVAAATDLDAGIHSVIVTDANGCIEYGILSLSNTGGMSISSTKTDINCSGEMNGTAAVTVTGGSQPYTYNWSGGETTSTLSGLSEGIYEVIVFDNDSCIAAASVAITAPDLLTVNVTKEDASCGIPDGAAAVAVAGGAPPYYYSWSTGSTGASESGLPAGLYFVAVTDNSGCLTTKSVAINNIGAPEIEVLSMNNTGCGMTSSGAIDIGVTGGAGGYSYQWNDSSTTQDITGLSEGEYAVTVSDSAGCVSIEHVIIESAMPAVQPICMVTVDSLTGKNLVVWDKSLVAPDISDFRIYKEGSASGVYNLIATVPYSDQSEYRDMAANPLQRSWRYRITAVDSCGNESEFSEIHKTMHLAINLGLGNKINLIWDPYEGFNYTTFVIYRGTNPNQIDSLDALPSTLHSYTDLNPPQTPNLYYIVSALYPGECTVQKMAKKYNSSKSNTAAQQMPIGIEELRISDCQNCGFRIYPNPANEYFTLEIYACLPDRQGNKEIFFTIYDILGRKVFKSEIRNPKSEIIIKDLPAGLYFYEVKNKDGVLGMGKLVIE